MSVNRRQGITLYGYFPIVHEFAPAFTPLLFSIWIYKEWKVFRRDCPSRRVQFVITDLWAAMLALTPTYFIVMGVFRSADPVTAEKLINCIPLVFGQLAGIVVYKIRAERESTIIEWYNSAAAVVGGGLVGLFVGAITTLALTPLGVLLIPLLLVFMLHESGKSKHHTAR